MNNKEFQEIMKVNGLRPFQLSKILEISPATITGWKKNNKYPMYLRYYFDNLKLKRQIAKLNSIISHKVIKQNEQ